MMRRYGFRHAFLLFQEAMKSIGERDAGTHRGEMARFAELALLMRIGNIVFEKVGADALGPYLPWNNVEFVPRGQRFKVTFRSLLREPGGMGTVYYSRLRPTVAVGGRERVVAYSKHAGTSSEYITLTLTPGTYYVRVLFAGTVESSPYRLRIEGLSF